jgi:hypothetical protein
MHLISFVTIITLIALLYSNQYVFTLFSITRELGCLEAALKEATFKTSRVLGGGTGELGLQTPWEETLDLILYA